MDVADFNKQKLPSSNLLKKINEEQKEYFFWVILILI